VIRQPSEVIFKFDQPVGGTGGAVRVYDSEGDEVDDGDVGHPGGRGPWLGVGLEPNLPDGTYTATYRVISADTHLVYGGLVFNLGHASAGGGVSVAGLIGKDQSGEVTKLGFGVVRFLDYLSIALMVGGLIFLVFAWRPAFAETRGSERRWAESAVVLGRRAAALLAFAVVLGVVVSVLGIVLQGASGAGVSLWSSLKWSIVGVTLDSRFGTVWLLRGIVWVLLGLLLLEYRQPPRTLRWPVPFLVLGAAYLASTPAFSGHASIESPVAVMFPSDFIHVLAASIWVGGVAFLVAALPAALRPLEPRERTRLLSATLLRISPIALASVVAIAVTGLVQAYVDVRQVADLWETSYGMLVLAKMVLLVVLVGFGLVNRDRMIPRVRRLVTEGAPPGSIGALARRTLRGELCVMLVVLGVTAALIAYTPPIDAAPGPFSSSAELGQAELRVTVEPAEVGLNTIQLVLADPRDGNQFKKTKELTVTAALPAKGIGPLKMHVRADGPGKYTVSGAQLSPGGTWDLEITDRVSAFDEFATTVSVPIG